MEQEILQALLNCIERYPEEGENKIWFTRLIRNSLSDNNDPKIDTDLIYNATVIESIFANLLSIDIKTIVKVRLVHRTISFLWEENGEDIRVLNNYILENKFTIINTDPRSPENVIHDQQDSETVLLE